MTTKYQKITVKQDTYDLFKLKCYAEFFRMNPQCEIFKEKLTEDDMVKRICTFYLESEE
jgi:hypothetical protein